MNLKSTEKIKATRKKHMLGEKGIHIHILKKKLWHMVQENFSMKLDDKLLYLLESCL